MTGVLWSLLPELPFPVSIPLAMDWRVLTFTGGLAVFAGLRPLLADHAGPGGPVGVTLLEGDLDITALSMFTYAHVQDRYILTSCGSSVGVDYGPKLVMPAGSISVASELNSASAARSRTSRSSGTRLSSTTSWSGGITC